MKKIIALLIALVFCFSLCACSDEKAAVDDSAEKTTEESKDENKESEKDQEKDQQKDKEEPSDDEEGEKKEETDENSNKKGEGKKEDEEDKTEEKKQEKKKEKPKKEKTETVSIYDAVTGTVTENGEPIRYDLPLTESGKVTINFKGKGIDTVKLKLYDEDGQEFWSEYPNWNSTSKQIAYKDELYLAAGNYSMTISKYYGVGDYELSVDFKSSGESFAETHGGSNNTFDDPSKIELDSVYWGQLALNDELDNYMFTLDEAGYIALSYKAQNIDTVRLKLYNEDGQEIWGESASWNSTSKQISYKSDIELTAGTYYFGVARYYGYGDYEIGIDFYGAGESFEEEQGGSDNTFDEANELSFGTEYVGQLAINDEIDNYTFELEDAKGIKINLKASKVERIQLKIYDEDGQEVWAESAGWNGTSKQISYEQEVLIEPGTYYLSVSRYYGYGDYTLELSSK